MTRWPLLLALLPCLAYSPVVLWSDIPNVIVSSERVRYFRDEDPKSQKVWYLAKLAFEYCGYDWGLECRDSMVELAWHESRLNPRSVNSVSNATGLYQFLDSTWKGTRVERTFDPFWQTVAGARYVAARYGCPCKALAFQKTPRLLNGVTQRYY